MHSKYPLTPGQFILSTADDPSPQQPRDPAAEANHLSWLVGLDSGVPPTLDSLADPPAGEKPDYSYLKMVALAIYSSEYKMLTLQGIYDAIQTRFPWFQTCENPSIWKNSVRHLLSLNAVFQKKINPHSGEGTGSRGSYWCLDLSKWGSLKRVRKRGPVPRRKNKKGNWVVTTGADDQTASDGEQDVDMLHSGSDDAGSVGGPSRIMDRDDFLDEAMVYSRDGSNYEQESDISQSVAAVRPARRSRRQRKELMFSDTEDELDERLHRPYPQSNNSLANPASLYREVRRPSASPPPTLPPIKEWYGRTSPIPRHAILPPPRMPIKPSYTSSMSNEFPHHTTPTRSYPFDSSSRVEASSATRYASADPRSAVLRSRPEYRCEIVTRLVPATFPPTLPH